MLTMSGHTNELFGGMVKRLEQPDDFLVMPFLRSGCRLQRINALRNRGSSMQVDR